MCMAKLGFDLRFKLVIHGLDSSVRLTTPCFDDKDIKREDDDFLTPETEQLCEMWYLPEGLSVYVFLLAADEPNPTVYCAFICRLKSEKKPTRNKLY